MMGGKDGDPMPELMASEERIANMYNRIERLLLEGGDLERKEKYLLPFSFKADRPFIAGDKLYLVNGGGQNEMVVRVYRLDEYAQRGVSKIDKIIVFGGMDSRDMYFEGTRDRDRVNGIPVRVMEELEQAVKEYRE